MPRIVAACAAAVLGLIAPLAAAETFGIAIVAEDRVPLRAAPSGAARVPALLWQGEALEVRGERMDYLQVYDHRRERAGFVRATQVRRFLLKTEETHELLSIVRFLRDSAGAEALGIGFAAAYVQAASPEILNGEPGIEVLTALGTFAERLARRASSGTAQTKAAQAALSAHLEVAAYHGVNFVNTERGGRWHVCYDGQAFRRVLAMRSSPEQRARAALAVTRQECMPGELRALERARLDEWRADALDRVDATALPPYLRNRVLMRRAGVWASLAYERARSLEQSGKAVDAAAYRALAELGGVSKTDLTDDDARAYREAAMRVSASRWAATPGADAKSWPRIATAAGEPGQTCVLLLGPKNGPDRPLAKRCTYGLVWTGSATPNREGTALALAVQPTDAWREMWIFYRSGNRWTVRVLPPAAMTPEVGYAEFAGWVPGGAQILVAREAMSEGRYKRNFEVVRLETLTPVRQASDPSILVAFQRWQDPSWKRQTLSLR